MEPSPFAHDPTRSPPLTVAAVDIEELLGENFLSTALVDFILQQALKQTLPEDVLVGTSICQVFN